MDEKQNLVYLDDPIKTIEEYNIKEGDSIIAEERILTVCNKNFKYFSILKTWYKKVKELSCYQLSNFLQKSLILSLTISGVSP